MTLITPKIEFFNSGLGLKLDHHSYVEFHGYGDSNSDSFNFSKPQLNPDIPPLVPPKMRIFNFGLKQKLDHYSDVEFHGDFDGDGFKAQKPIIDPLIGHN